jgi:hypothetical protein
MFSRWDSSASLQYPGGSEITIRPEGAGQSPEEKESTLRNLTSVVGALVMCLLVAAGPVCATDDNVRAELEKVKKELEDIRKERAKDQEDMRKERAANKPVGTGVVDKMIGNRYGPDATVTTKTGKLTIGGLLQVWYYSIQNDNLGFFGGAARPIGDTNEGKDNDSFAIRRAELKFTMDISENVTAVVLIDPAAGFANRPSFNTNLGTSLGSATASVSDSAPEVGTTRLQDAFINYHGVIPHHDFQIGQFIPFIGNEGIVGSGALDFAERSMIGQLGNAYDVGLSAHGTWWDDRFQYWLGVYNTPTSFLAPLWQNRADNNDEKSLAVRMLVRPVWKNETWGSLELGASGQWNKLGEAGGDDLAVAQVDGLNVPNADESRYYFWAEYKPGGPVKGWWMKGEYAKIRGVQQSGEWTLTDLNGTDYWVMGTTASQTNPRAFDTDGWYVSTGYKLEDSIFKDDLPNWFKPFEFCFRYETYGNIQVADLARPDLRHDVWKSSIYTAGINYYIKGHNAKIQVNYSWANEPAEDHDGSLPNPRLIRDVRNDNLVVNFQVAW